jgi:hypothetical protein
MQEEEQVVRALPEEPDTFRAGYRARGSRRRIYRPENDRA